MTWIRWDVRAPRSEVVAFIADRLKLRVYAAHGLYVAMCCGFGAERPDGRIDQVTDTALETWAGWDGRRGRFAAAIREWCSQGTDPGILRGWWRNEAVLREQERSARKPDGRKGRPPEHPRKIPGESPEGLAGDSPVESRGNVYVDELPTTHHPTEAVPGFAALFARLPEVGGVRIAVTEFLEASPKGRERGWIGVLTACLDGLDMPDGKPCPPERLATVCRDFLTKPLGDWNARFFRACVATPEPGGSSGASSSGASERTIRAAADFAEEGAA